VRRRENQRSDKLPRGPVNLPITAEVMATTGVLWQSTIYMHCTFSHTHNNLFVHLLIQVPRFYLRGKEFDDAEFSSLLRILPQIPDELRLLDCGITPSMMERLSQRLDETEHHVSNIQCTKHVGIRKSLK